MKLSQQNAIFWNKKTQIVFYQATLDFNIVYSWIMYSLLQIKT